MGASRSSDSNGLSNMSDTGALFSNGLLFLVPLVYVVIVADQPLVALGLRNLLTAIAPNMHATVVAPSWSYAVSACRRDPAPHLLVADLDLIGVDRHQLAQDLCTLARSTPVLALTGSPTGEEAQTFQGPSMGYGGKAASIQELKQALATSLSCSAHRGCCVDS